MYPRVPDANWISEATAFVFERGFRYKDTNVKLGRSTILGEDSMLGSGVIVGDGATIVNSIVGAGCVIEEGAMICDSFLWNGVTVKKNAVVEHAVICDGSVVGVDAKVSRGCVLAAHTVIGSRVHIYPFDRITTVTVAAENRIIDAENNDFDDTSFGAIGSSADQDKESSYESTHDANVSEETVVGVDGVGRRWVMNCASERMSSSSEWAIPALDKLSNIQKRKMSMTFVGGSVGCTELENERRQCWDTAGDLARSLDDEEEEPLSDEDISEDAARDKKLIEFVSELLCVDEMIEPAHESIALELNGQKFAQNRTFSDLVFVMVPTIVLSLSKSSKNKESARAIICSSLNRWKNTFDKIVQGIKEEVTMIQAIELIALYGVEQARVFGLALSANILEPEDFQRNEPHPCECTFVSAAFPFVLSEMYQKDFVSHEAVIEWNNSHDNYNLPRDVIDSQVTQLVLEQLMSEDDSEEDETEDEE